MRSPIAVLLVSVVVSLAGPVRAQTPGTPEAKAKARESFRTATQHYDLGEFEEALHDFKEAYRNYEEPTFLFNVGQCHRQLGQKDQAVRFFKVYLTKVPNASNRVEVRDMISKLEAALQQEHALTTGKPQGTLSPPEARPEPEEAKPESKTPGTEVRPQGEAQPAPSPQPAATIVEKAAPVRAETPIYKRWWLWTAVGVVVVVGVGIGVGVGLSPSGSTPSATTTLGTYKPY